ncbi:MAG: YifB family Mg chelatase-like AAA ATPase [Rhodobacteraceae bacterium]|nr:YifB family Mg chelatase-like AAA ATPase [Paracoccaceae bacterium]
MNANVGVIARSYTVAFHGVEAKKIEVQVALSSGIPAFNLVGLPDKAVSEAKERVRAAITALGLALPAKRITINLSPADMLKTGSHFDLPIALTLMAAMDVLPREQIEGQYSLGELSLDGSLVPVTGALPAALTAAQDDCGLICPAACGPEAAWVEAARVLAPRNLLELVNHFSGRTVLSEALPGEVQGLVDHRDLRDVRGQEKAKRALEVAAAGGHHLLMVGPPGSGKSMMAARMPGLLPPLSPSEALETSMIHSLAGVLEEGGISRQRPFRTPHHTASMAAMVGGGRGAKPGEISLAHNGVLFMDEFPEFPRAVLETLRQPIETGDVVVSRANAHVRYPARFMLLAAANPCKCGYMGEIERACGRAPQCGADYLSRISGPLLDRFDLRIEVPAVAVADLSTPPTGETSAVVAARVRAAREIQAERYKALEGITTNVAIEGDVLEQACNLRPEASEMLLSAVDKFRLSARAFHRIQRVGRTIADLRGEDEISKAAIAEAIGYRLAF